ncbi:hypothetical protein BGZ51_009304 [Haplosporangium sp. Z 767]|nr:hypothetical protein BGZ51_009304 [Haplosporangium sp. Z 767]
MGQVNSTQANSSKPFTDQYSTATAPGASPSPSSSVPSVEDIRNLPSRILAVANDGLKNLRENIPAGLSSGSSTSTSSTSSGASGAEEANAAAAAVTEGLGFTTDSEPLVVMRTADNQVLVYKPFGNDSETSVTDLIKIHFQLSMDWVKDNAKTVAVGVFALGVAVVVGTVAVNTVRAHRQKMRRLRVLKSREGAKREVVVLTNVATLESAALAMSLDKEGFIVFVGVSSQGEADRWSRRADIHPVIVDTTKTNSVEDLVKAVSTFLDQNNSILLGGNLAPLSSSVILQEELSSSTANIQLVNPEQNALKNVSAAEAKHHHHGKTDSPLFRLVAVIVNPHSSVVAPIEKVDLEEWRQSIDSNITGTIIVVQKFMPLMRRTLALAKPIRSPRLVILSSAITGSIGFPYQSAICASHHAIESIADSLRREVKVQGVDVICLRPGITDRHFRKEWSDRPAKANAGGLGLLNAMNPVALLRSSFKSTTTTSALCDAVYDAITSKRPSSNVRVGSGSLSYSFVGWAVPRYVVDWSIKPAKAYAPVTIKITTTSSSKNTREEQ